MPDFDWCNRAIDPLRRNAGWLRSYDFRMPWVRPVLLCLPLMMVAPTLAAAGDPQAGATVFKKCYACHEVGEGAKLKVGPILNGLIGRKAGTYAGYNYTDANKNSGLVWDEPTLAQYLKNPKALIPGTKMVFPGLPKEKDIDDLIAYLKQFGPDGKPAS
jgi:cytochrome c